MKHSLDRHTCKTYTRSTVADGLSVLRKGVSLVNEWQLTKNILIVEMRFETLFQKILIRCFR